MTRALGYFHDVAITADLETRAIPEKRTFAVGPERVWDVLCDGWVYPTWVVGASRMRDVDAHWPSPGARLHHSVGIWPLVIDDKTEVLAAEPARSLRLRAHAWPGGAAEVLLEIEPSPEGCIVSMREDAVAGPGLLMPRPLRQLMIKPRNRESLQRLAFIAENR